MLILLSNAIVARGSLRFLHGFCPQAASALFFGCWSQRREGGRARAARRPAGQWRRPFSTGAPSVRTGCSSLSAPNDGVSQPGESSKTGRLCLRRLPVQLTRAEEGTGTGNFPRGLSKMLTTGHLSWTPQTSFGRQQFPHLMPHYRKSSGSTWFELPE